MDSVLIVGIICVALIVFVIAQFVISNKRLNDNKKYAPPVHHAPIPWYDKDGKLFLIDDDYIKSQSNEI